MYRHTPRLWLVVCLMTGCSASLPALPEEEADALSSSRALGTKVRLVAANVSSGSSSTYDQPATERLMQAIKPDIALLQEFKVQSQDSGALQQWLDATLGPGFSYHREPTLGIPNAIVSRWPITQSGTWDDPMTHDREFAWARIDVPGDRDLWAVSVHLLTTGASNRSRECSALASHLRANVPEADFLVVGGDFNSRSRSESCFQTLAGWVQTPSSPPVDTHGNSHTNSSRNRPYDHLLVDSDLDAQAVPTVVGQHSFATGWVVDTRSYEPLADLAPAQRGDSDAPQMQHMPVVRDFVVASVTHTATLSLTHPNGGEALIAGSEADIVWQSNGLTAVDVAVSVNGLDWTDIALDVLAASGRFTWTVPSLSTDAARVRVKDSQGTLVGESASSFRIVLEPAVDAGSPTPPQVVINEVLVNEPGTDVRQEFVELVNIGSSPLSLEGWSLSDSVQVRHRFAAPAVLEAGAAWVVVASTASTGSLGLSNGGDSVVLRDAAGVEKARVDCSPAQASEDGVSLTRQRDGDPATGFVSHRAVSPLGASPGTRADGSAFTP